MDSNQDIWHQALLPSGQEECLWQIYHENSKIGRHQQSPSNKAIHKRMKELHESLPYEGYPVISLPASRLTTQDPVELTIASRTSCRNFSPDNISLEQLNTILHYAYGVNRPNTDNSEPRPFRMVPSGGALYPLEILFFASHVENLDKGLYHYNPTLQHLRQLRKGDDLSKLLSCMIYPDFIKEAGAIIFLTALFERSTFKYDERGYRFVLLEAGHVSQNINLMSTGLSVGCLNIGGFYDREVDSYLGLDGIDHSTLYIQAIGHKSEEPGDGGNS